MQFCSSLGGAHACFSHVHSRRLGAYHRRNGTLLFAFTEGLWGREPSQKMTNRSPRSLSGARAPSSSSQVGSRPGCQTCAVCLGVTEWPRFIGRRGLGLVPCSNGRAGHSRAGGGHRSSAFRCPKRGFWFLPQPTPPMGSALRASPSGQTPESYMHLKHENVLSFPLRLASRLLPRLLGYSGGGTRGFPNPLLGCHSWVPPALPTAGG